MKVVLDQSGFGSKWFWIKVVLDEIGLGLKWFWMNLYSTLGPPARFAL